MANGEFTIATWNSSATERGCTQTRILLASLWMCQTCWTEETVSTSREQEVVPCVSAGQGKAAAEANRKRPGKRRCLSEEQCRHGTSLRQWAEEESQSQSQSQSQVPVPVPTKGCSTTAKVKHSSSIRQAFLQLGAPISASQDQWRVCRDGNTRNHLHRPAPATHLTRRSWE